MKPQITIGAGHSSFGTLMLFFICFLFGFNSHSQKVQTFLGERWKNGTWESMYKTSYTYDVNGYKIHDLTQDFDVAWKDQSRTDYNNNPDGTLRQSIAQLWDISSNEWKNRIRTTNTYTGAKKVHTSETEMWLDPNLMPTYSKATHTYDGNNYNTNSLTQIYDYTSSSFNDKYRITYDNNLDGTVRQSVSETWNLVAWVYLERISITYNNSILTIQLYEKWNGTIWENMERVTNVYTDYRITKVREKWTGAIWENVSMETADYDGNAQLIQLLSQNWEAGSWKNDTMAIYTNNGNGWLVQMVSQEWDDVGSVWNNLSRNTFTYDTLGVDDPIFDKSFALYPNPAQDKITIKTTADHVGVNYLVADQLGRQFSNGTITDMETVINVDQFSAGIYYIQMGQNKNETIKMVKK